MASTRKRSEFCHCETQPMKAGPWVFTPDIETRYSKRTNNSKFTLWCRPYLPRILMQTSITRLTVVMHTILACTPCKQNHIRTLCCEVSSSPHPLFYPEIVTSVHNSYVDITTQTDKPCISKAHRRATVVISRFRRHLAVSNSRCAIKVFISPSKRNCPDIPCFHKH